MTKGNWNLAHSRRTFLKGAAGFAFAHAVRGGVVASAGTFDGRNFRAYIGSYTSPVDGSGNGEGIYLVEVNSRTGDLSQPRLAAKTPNPSWIGIHPSKRYLYAVNEVINFNGSSGSVSAFSVNSETGELSLLNCVSSEGAGPAHLSIDTSGKFVFVANYFGGSIAVLPIRDGGLLGPAVYTHRDADSIGARRATNAPHGSFAISGHDAPHAHMIAADPNNKFVLATDLGQDRIYVYRFDSATGMLTTPEETPSVSLPSGDGPRHFVFHPNGRWLYSVQEESSTIAFWHYDPRRGAITLQDTISTLPAGFAGTSFTSEIQMSPDARFLYCANRLHDSIAVCSIAADGRLKLVGEVSSRGDYPRHFQFDPKGNFLYVCNQRSDCIASFKVRHDSGMLEFTGQYTAVGSPAMITFFA